MLWIFKFDGRDAFRAPMVNGFHTKRSGFHGLRVIQTLPYPTRPHSLFVTCVRRKKSIQPFSPWIIIASDYRYGLRVEKVRKRNIPTMRFAMSVLSTFKRVRAKSSPILIAICSASKRTNISEKFSQSSRTAYDLGVP